MTEFTNFFIPLLFVHLLCDFYFQPDCWIAAKKQHTFRSYTLYLHSALHGLLLCLPAWVFDFDWQVMWYAVPSVAVSHFIIDLWKASSPHGSKVAYFIADQLLHILVLAAVAFALTPQASIAGVVSHTLFAQSLLVLVAYALILKPTSIFIRITLKSYGAWIEESDTASNEKNHGLVAGGELIGYLERVLIFTLTLVGSFAAVGFVLAAKSIFRFGELSKSPDRRMTEYVLIGSLLSVVITTLIGTLVALALGTKIK